jgi:hypothetical protein
MTAEILKLRALPTARWTAAGVGAALLTAVIVALFRGVGVEDDVAVGLGAESAVAVGLGAELPTALASIILGAWIVGLEYGQGTMRRALTADPRRMRFVGAKLGTAALAAAALTAAAFVVCVVAFPAIASAHDTTLPLSDLLRTGAAATVGNITGALLGASIAFIVRSMAGGLTVAFVFTFVVDTALSAIPRVGEWTAQSASADLYEAIIGEPDAPSALRAALVVGGWVAVAAVAGALRFARSDV